MRSRVLAPPAFPLTMSADFSHFLGRGGLPTQEEIWRERERAAWVGGRGCGGPQAPRPPRSPPGPPGPLAPGPAAPRRPKSTTAAHGGLFETRTHNLR